MHTIGGCGTVDRQLLGCAAGSHLRDGGSIFPSAPVLCAERLLN
jgi:hypothetical protein